jgi:hypothetical protein
MPEVYDHLRSTDPDDDAGIYRVVGTHADSVTLLRVADGDGRRAHTGEVITVPTDALDAFEPAENPDGNRSLGGQLRSLGGSLYWSFRSAMAALADRPLLTALGLGLYVAGRFAGGRLPLPDLALSMVALAGIVVVAAVASGRV